MQKKERKILSCISHFKDDIIGKWKNSQEQIEISYEGLPSKLENTDSCYLCGKENRSLTGNYCKFDTIGLISLNNWYILDFKLAYHKNSEWELIDESSRNAFSNIDDVCYTSESIPSRGRASIKVTLPERYDLDTTIIQEGLCQACLDKVTSTLIFSKRKGENLSESVKWLAQYRKSGFVGFVYRDGFTQDGALRIERGKRAQGACRAFPYQFDCGIEKHFGRARQIGDEMRIAF